MNLSQALELDDVTPEEARREVERHHASWEEFLQDAGEKAEYSGDEVLGWLGY